MEVIKTLKGGSLSNTKILWDGHNKIVRKSISINNNREYGLVRWQSQIRKLQHLHRYLPEFSVSIKLVGQTDGYYFYDLPYYENHINCYEALLKGESVDVIVNKIHNLLSRLAKISYGSTQGPMGLYIAEEIIFPLQAALEIGTHGRLPINDNELLFFNSSVCEALDIIQKILVKVKNERMQESLTHGNLTLENILWNTETKELLMIDPYAETYCESIMGDVSQLLQSSKSGYEFISNIYDKEDICIHKYPIDKIPKCFVNFSEQLIKKIEVEDWYSDSHLTLFHASQFTRMFPFKLVNSPRQGVAFLMYGINLLKTIQC